MFIYFLYIVDCFFFFFDSEFFDQDKNNCSLLFSIKYTNI